jgi:hypothetical protein
MKLSPGIYLIESGKSYTPLIGSVSAALAMPDDLKRLK